MIEQQIKEALLLANLKFDHEASNWARDEIDRNAIEWLTHQQSIISQQAEEIESLKKDVGYRQEEIKRQMGYNLEKSRENVKLEKEIKRLQHIAGLLASRIDISDEVFDALSMEDDYEFYASKARKENPHVNP